MAGWFSEIQRWLHGAEGLRPMAMPRGMIGSAFALAQITSANAVDFAMHES